jgi:hypothetical protein
MKTLLFLLSLIALLSASPVSVNSGTGHMGSAGAPTENYCIVCNNKEYVSLQGYSGSEYLKSLICLGRKPSDGVDSLAKSSSRCPCDELLFFYFF